MSGYNVSNIVNINTRISPTGLGFANFASAVGFANGAEATASGLTVDSFVEYSSIVSLEEDWPATTETYKMGAKWLSGIPSSNSISIWITDEEDEDIAASTNKARGLRWWYWSFYTDDVYASVDDVLALAAKHDGYGAYFMNCQVGPGAEKIRTDAADNIAKQLTTLGYRHTSTFAHATDAYAGIALCKFYAAVNYSAAGSTITGEYKKLTGVASEDLDKSEYTAMLSDTNKCMFYTNIDSQGGTDSGRVINSRSHSSYGEWMDDIVNLDAFANAVRTSLSNLIMNQTTKLGQDMIGQAMLIGNVRQICEMYIANNYLGERNYTDPQTAQPAYTRGYEILTKPEDILGLLDADRAARKAAPLRLRIYRKGAIHLAAADIDVF